MIAVLNGFIKEFEIGISKWNNFERIQFQSISLSAKFSYWGSLRLPATV